LWKFSQSSKAAPLDRAAQPVNRLSSEAVRSFFSTSRDDHAHTHTHPHATLNYVFWNTLLSCTVSKKSHTVSSRARYYKILNGPFTQSDRWLVMGLILSVKIASHDTLRCHATQFSLLSVGLWKYPNSGPLFGLIENKWPIFVIASGPSFFFSFKTFVGLGATVIETLNSVSLTSFKFDQPYKPVQ
jgi:hypothetical protein